jgi:hypothetical protein
MKRQSRCIDLTAVRSRSHSGRRRLEPAAHKTKSIRLKSKAAITRWSNGSGTLLLVRYFHQRLPTTYEPVGKNWKWPFGREPGCPCCRRPSTGIPIWTRSKNSAARCRGIRTHPWERGISWKITGVHPNRRTEFHEVRHRRGLMMAVPGYMAARSCI